jgi:osmoprotectant transport system permease protein
MLALLSGTVAPLAASDCLRANKWLCWEYVTSRQELIKHAVVQHVTLTALALALALIIAFPLALLALRSSWLRVSVLGVLGIIYTIPSLSLFVLLQPAFGVTHATPVVIALVAYAQLLLVRNVVVGLEEVPGEVLEAARGMGYGRTRLLFSVRLPLAMPALMAGLRVTTVSTIALLTVGGLIQQGGLGNLLVDGFNNSFNAQIFTSIVLIVALALLADLLLLLVQRLLTPWDRKRRRAKAAA